MDNQAEKERYNGWENWDTWNTSLWLNNDESSYKEARRICHTSIFNWECEKRLTELAKLVIPATEDIDYQSVNWEEIYDDFNEE